MIKFFRQIRFKLMNENKTSRYFKYAIGEIVLVVIGILIALQINNWNENQKEEKKAQILFEDLYVELEDAAKNIKRNNIGNEVYVNFLGEILNKWDTLDLGVITNIRKNKFDFVNFSTLFYLSSYSQFNDVNSDMYQKAINDGTINLIDKDFTNMLSSTYRIIFRLNEIINQEYELGKEINLHIANNYSDILVQSKIGKNPSIDNETLNKLFFAFRTDGALKHLIKSRLDLARIRGLFLLKNSETITKDLKKFKPLLQ